MTMTKLLSQWIFEQRNQEIDVHWHLLAFLTPVIKPRESEGILLTFEVTK